MVALVGVLNGLGVVTMNSIYGRLPTYFVDQGVEAIWAGRYSLFIVVGFCLLTAVV